MQITFNSKWKTQPPSGAQRTGTTTRLDLSNAHFHFGKTTCFRPFRTTVNTCWTCSGKFTRLPNAGLAKKINVYFNFPTISLDFGRHREAQVILLVLSLPVLLNPVRWNDAPMGRGRRVSTHASAHLLICPPSSIFPSSPFVFLIGNLHRVKFSKEC